MAELYMRIEKLCKDKGVTVTEMCKQSGAPRGSLTDLKMGRISGLSLETLSKIANYFDVDVWLLVEYQSTNSEKEKAPADNGEDLADYLQDLRERPETRALLEASKGMTKVQVEQMAAFAKALRGGD